MALSISKKEVEDIKPYLEKTVSKFLGFREPSLVTTLMHCLSSGYDKFKTAGKYFYLKLTTYLYKNYKLSFLYHLLIIYNIIN